MAEAERELRILTGVHAGARARADQEFLIGAGADCDIVLTDAGIAPRHARVQLSGTHWTVLTLGEDGATLTTGEDLPSGARIALGQVLISIDAANAPWQAPYEPDTEQDPDRAGGTAASGINQADPALPALALSGPRARLLALLVQGRQYARSALEWTRRAWRLSAAHPLLSLPVLLMALLAALSLSLLESGETLRKPTMSDRPMTGSAVGLAQTGAAPDALPPVLKTLRNNSLRIERGSNGVLRVLGFVASEDDYSTLAGLVSKISPRPLLRVYIDQELRDGTARWNSTAGNQGRQLVYLGEGRFRLEGISRDNASSLEMLRAVREEFPMLTDLEDALTLFPQTGENLKARLQQAGLQGFSATWQGDRYLLEFGALSPEDMTTLEAESLKFNRDTGGAFPFRINATRAPAAGLTRRLAASPKSGPAAAVAAPKLPFEIRSVVGGKLPYLVLADQSRLLPGGEMAGFRLIEISPTELIFERVNNMATESANAANSAKVVIQR